MTYFLKLFINLSITYSINSCKVDSLHNLSYKEEFEGDTKRSTAAYKKVREDASIGSTYKLPLERGYARGLIKPVIMAGGNGKRL
nr:palindromic element RPE1 domain-containing protein [Candidatus Rickettsia colombianensi]